MYQFPVISVLLVSVLVGQVHPTPLKEQLNSSGLNSTSSKNETDASIKNSTEAIALETSRASHTEGSSSKANETEISLGASRSLSGNESTSAERTDSQEKDHPCHYKKETEDMVKCYAMPHDNDDGEIADTTKGSNGTVPQKDTTMKGEIPLADQHGLVYHTVSPNGDKKAKTNLTDSTMGDAKMNNNRTEQTVSSVAPLLADKVHNGGNSENSAKVTKPEAEDEERKNMPSGIIALVTAITFILAVVFTYITVIAWRRYVEHKYGHRELLVNDLEFDTNDLRHFEL